MSPLFNFMFTFALAIVSVAALTTPAQAENEFESKTKRLLEYRAQLSRFEPSELERVANRARALGLTVTRVASGLSLNNTALLVSDGSSGSVLIQPRQTPKPFTLTRQVDAAQDGGDITYIDPMPWAEAGRVLQAQLGWSTIYGVEFEPGTQPIQMLTATGRNLEIIGLQMGRDDSSFEAATTPLGQRVVLRSTGGSLRVVAFQISVPSEGVTTGVGVQARLGGARFFAMSVTGINNQQPDTSSFRTFVVGFENVWRFKPISNLNTVFTLNGLGDLTPPDVNTGNIDAANRPQIRARAEAQLSLEYHGLQYFINQSYSGSAAVIPPQYYRAYSYGYGREFKIGDQRFLAEGGWMINDATQERTQVMAFSLKRRISDRAELTARWRTYSNDGTGFARGTLWDVGMRCRINSRSECSIGYGNGGLSEAFSALDPRSAFRPVNEGSDRPKLRISFSSRF